MLTRSAAQPLAEQLAGHFAQRVRDRLLAPGARLPSVRQCAQQQRVSPATVVAAYDRLLADGLVEARRNRGFYVRESAAQRASAGKFASKGVAAEAPPPAAQPFHAATLMRGMFHSSGDKPHPGLGVLPPDWLETDFLPAALRRVTATRAAHRISLRYGDPMGDAGLRAALSRRLADMEIDAPDAQIVTTVGATHALDIVSRTLLRAGDPVMVEEPGWAVEFARLASLGLRILPVPRGPNGPDLAVMERYCEAHAPKLYVSVSVLHNPTGHCLSPASAHSILQLAARHNFLVVEDDTYGALAPEHATRMCALDNLRRTIHVGGFAKILAPSWRIGFVAASPALTERFLDTKLLSTLTTPAVLETALAGCIEQGLLRRHSERVRTKLGAARDRSVKLASQAGCTFAAEPAGLFGWVDTGVDTDAMAQRMLDEGYLLAPGALFHAQRKPGTLMRINFATTQDAAFWKVYPKLRRAVAGQAPRAAGKP